MDTCMEDAKHAIVASVVVLLVNKNDVSKVNFVDSNRSSSCRNIVVQRVCFSVAQ